MVKEIIKELPLGLINWYDFELNSSSILYIGNYNESINLYLKNKFDMLLHIDFETLNNEEYIEKITNIIKNNKLDYIIIIGLENIKKPNDIIGFLKKNMKNKGKLLIGADNRLAIKYFCGEKDPFTLRNFDGIENYKNSSEIFGNCKLYSKSEIKNILENNDLNYNFFSVFPNIQMPQLIFNENFTPNEELAGRYFPKYNNPYTIFLQEEFLYSDLIENNMFHSMANGFFIECDFNNDFCSAQQISISIERGKEQAIATIIHKDKVEKKMLYNEGLTRLKNIKSNTEYLLSQGINIIEGSIDNLSYNMPFIKGDTLVVNLRKLFFENIDKFIEQMDCFRNLILSSSKHIEEHPTKGTILERCYIDLVPLNCIQSLESNKIIFFDQEVYLENMPANIPILRSIQIIYINDPRMEKILPSTFFFERYNLLKELDYYNKESNDFLNTLCNKESLLSFWRKYERDFNILNSNRQRLNFSSIEYQRIFVDLFKDIENKNVFIFGAGKFTDKFMTLYGKDYNISGILDNNKKNHGKSYHDLPIYSPNILEGIDPNNLKIIICIKNYMAIIDQLENMNINKYCIYDPSISYEKKKNISSLNNLNTNTDNTKSPKKYNVGYVPGVFDLFHVGHLNLLKKAKEQCNYLIVGVVSDEGVIKYKKTENIVPCTERMAIVEACKYVDEVVKIPLDYNSAIEAYNLYRFDCHFSGDDYKNNPYWLSAKTFLESQGSNLIFLPYTKSTSSSKLKGIINEKLSSNLESNN